MTLKPQCSYTVCKYIGACSFSVDADCGGDLDSFFFFLWEICNQTVAQIITDYFLETFSPCSCFQIKPTSKETPCRAEYWWGVYKYCHLGASRPWWMLMIYSLPYKVLWGQVGGWARLISETYIAFFLA